MGADRKFERLAAIDGQVEFLALGAVLIKPAGIVHRANLPGLRRSAGADFCVDDLKAGRCGGGRLGDGRRGGGNCRDDGEH